MEEAALDGQIKQVEQGAIRIAEKHGLPYAGIRSERESAWKVSWRDRPELKLLFRRLQRADHLVVWRLDRLDRQPFELVHICEWLKHRNINLHLLDGGMQLDLGKWLDRTLVFLQATHSDMWLEQLSRATSRGLRARIEAGKPATAWRYGWRRAAPEPGKRSQGWEPAEKEREQIRAIFHRHEGGESWDSIAQDFYTRRLKTPVGRMWVQKNDRTGELNHSRLRRVYRRYREFGEQWERY